MYMRKNIVILSTMYYPDMGAPSSVIDRYVQLFKTKYNFYIITKTYKDLSKTLLRDDVVYIDSWRHRMVLKCEQNIKANKDVWLSKLMLVGINLYKLIETQFLHPTSNAWESSAYYYQLEQLSKKVKIDVVISVSNTCFTQFAAYKFKSEHPDVRWIQFVTDPFSENHIYYRYKLFPNLWKKINMNDERKFYDKCNAAFLTPELFDVVKQKFPESAYKCYQMQFTLTDLSKYKRHTENKDDIIKLVYAGAVYKDIRNPEFMMQTIAAISNIKLDMFTNKGANRGECDSILERNVSSNISVFDFAPKDKYNDMICNEYDILVNIGNISTLQSPSKTLDLLSTGKPILNFYFVKDSQYMMIEKYPLGLNICCNEEGAVERVKLFCEKVKGRSMNYDEVKKLYPENVLASQAAVLEKLING